MQTNAGRRINIGGGLLALATLAGFVLGAGSQAWGPGWARGGPHAPPSEPDALVDAASPVAGELEAEGPDALHSPLFPGATRGQATMDESASGNPMYSASEALDTCLTHLPAGLAPTASVARLMTLNDFDAWSGTSGPDFEGHVPVWVVAIIADGLTRPDVMPVPGTGVQPTPVTGAVCVWDANSGDLVALGPASDQDIVELSAMPDALLTIEPATSVPPAPTINPAFIPPEPTPVP
jgi:hypothetical protein